MQMTETPSEHPIDTAARIVGGRSELVKGLALHGVQVGLTALGNWKSRITPEKACVALEKLTDRQVTRRDLRPEDWLAIWPELAAAEPVPTPEVEAGA